MKIDADDSGQISVEEWITWWLRRVSCLPNPLKQQEAIAKNTFKKFDTDDSGSLDTSELHSLIESLGEKLITVNLYILSITATTRISFSVLCIRLYYLVYYNM